MVNGKCFNEQMLQWLKDELGEIRQDIKAVDNKVDSLVEMRAKLMGMAAVVSLLLTFLMQFAFQILQKKMQGGI
jgi:hypothetical protein